MTEKQLSRKSEERGTQGRLGCEKKTVREKALYLSDPTKRQKGTRRSSAKPMRSGRPKSASLTSQRGQKKLRHKRHTLSNDRQFSVTSSATRARFQSLLGGVLAPRKEEGGGLSSQLSSSPVEAAVCLGRWSTQQRMAQSSSRFRKPASREKKQKNI